MRSVPGRGRGMVCMACVRADMMCGACGADGACGAHGVCVCVLNVLVYVCVNVNVCVVFCSMILPFLSSALVRAKADLGKRSKKDFLTSR